MDPLPDLHPIVIPSIYSRPFECFGEGLRFRGPQGLRYARESLVSIKALLFTERDEEEETDAMKKNKFKKFKSKSFDSRMGNFWNAQLRLYGVESQPSKPNILRKIFKEAIQNGLRGPPRRLIQLEAQLNQQFVVENAQERDKQYEALTDTEKKIGFFPKRFFRDFFADEKEALFTFQQQFSNDVQDAVDTLGLHFYCSNVHGESCTIVGRDVESVRAHSEKIEEMRELGMERNGKRQKVEEDTPDQGKQKSNTVELKEDENDQENFRKMDVTQMDRLWRTLDDDKKLELYPTRFLSEHFFSEGRENFVQAFKDSQTKNRLKEIRAAAELLGLRVAIIENVPGEFNEAWTIIGRDKTAVEVRKKEIEALQYETLSETEKFEQFPKRFLLEQLLEQGNESKEKVVIFKIGPLQPLPDVVNMEELLLEHVKNGNEKVVVLKTPPGQKLLDAVTSLGLLIEADVVGLRWIFVGRDSSFVRECVKMIRVEREKPERHWVEDQVEAMRKEVEEAVDGTGLPFDDVKGEWSIECDGVEWNDGDLDELFVDDDDIYEKAEDPGENQNAVGYQEALKKMSIFFHTPAPKEKNPSAAGVENIEETEGTNPSAAGAENIEEAEGTNPEPTSPRLCANFFLGLFGGLLRSTSATPQSLSFPSEEIPFTFKGWDEAAGEPFDESREPREGSLTFHSRCLFKGVLKSMYGVMNLVGRKMSHKPNVECYDWDEL